MKEEARDPSPHLQVPIYASGPSEQLMKYSAGRANHKCEMSLFP